MKKFTSVMCIVFALLIAFSPLTVNIASSEQAFGITAQAASVKLNATKKTLVKGQTYTLKISGTSKKVKWSTSKKSVATVDGKGKVTAKGKGKATITATVSGTKYTCKITVEAPKINKTALTLVKAQTYTLKVSDTSQSMKWSTSDSKIVTVSSKGKLTAKAKGKATITCKLASGKKYTCKVTVETPSINKKSLTLEEGNTYTLKVSSTSQSMKWSSSDKSIASVNSSGVVTAKKAGTVEIKCKLSCGKTYTCTVTVKAPAVDLKKISTVNYDTGKGIVSIVKNNNKMPINVMVTVLYYDDNGNLIDTHSDENYCLESGKSCALRISGPYDSNYKNVEYASYKVKVTAEKVSNYIYSGVDDVSVYESNSPVSEKVITEVTNTGIESYSYIHLSIVFFDEFGDCIGYDESYAHCESAGSTDYINFEYPYDENYDTIAPYSYEIYVDYAYDYSWNR